MNINNNFFFPKRYYLKYFLIKRKERGTVMHNTKKNFEIESLFDGWKETFG